MPDIAAIKQPNLERSSFLWLLVALVFVLLIGSVVEGTAVDQLLRHFGLTLSFVASLWAYRFNRVIFIFGFPLTILAVSLTWGTYFSASPLLFATSCFLGSALFVVVSGLLLSTIVRKHVATVQSIYGSICIYLLLGLAWALVYSAIDRVDVGSFELGHRRMVVLIEGGPQVTAFTQFVYFSFVTMSTLGYGDITPKSAVAETVTWMQSVIGQFYFALLVSRMVSALPAVPRRDQTTHPSQLRL